MRLFPRALHVVGPAVLIVSVTLSVAPPAHAQGRIGEIQVKAAFLYNLAKFVQWPPSADGSQLVVGVIGNDFFSIVLDDLVRGKSVQGREIVVRRLGQDDDLRANHVVFVDAPSARERADTLQRVEDTGVLTVSDAPGFLREGGHVRFYVENNHVRVEIDADRADQAGLKIDSQLLSLARR